MSMEMPNRAVEVIKIPEKSREEIEKEKAEITKRKVVIARELSENRESFPFPGINPYSYQSLRAVEEEFPGMATPIDEIVQRLAREGMKVVFGNDPQSGNVFILPSGSDDIENDGIFPKHLQIADGMNEKIRELIALDRN